MAATSVDGRGKGGYPRSLDKIEPNSNVKKTLVVKSSLTLPEDINVVILNFNEDDDCNIELPDPKTKIGSEITFISKCQSTYGNSFYITPVFGETYNFSNSCIIFKLISDGEEWLMSDYYNYD
jgi:hypothetical protein